MLTLLILEARSEKFKYRTWRHLVSRNGTTISKLTFFSLLFYFFSDSFERMNVTNNKCSDLSLTFFFQ